MLMLTLALLFLCISATTQAATKCYACASSDLEADYQLTGLPNKPPTFTASCQTLPSDATLKAKLETSCSGYCMTYMFQKLSSQGSGAASSYSVVRGCHSSLTGISSDWVKISTASFCEFGTKKEKDSTGTSQSLNHYVGFCNTDDCNTDDIKLTGCSGSGSTKLATKCWRCMPGESCKSDSNQCQSTRWCEKQVVGLDKFRQTIKQCSPVNPFMISTCRSYSMETFIEPTRLNANGVVCYCDGDNCNGSASLQISIFAIVSVLSCIFFLSKL